MKSSAGFFYSASFFLIGVFLVSVFAEWASKFWIAGGIALLVGAALFLLDRRAMALCSLVIILGAGYALVFDLYRLDSNLPVGQKAELTGMVVKAEQGMESQELVVDVQPSVAKAMEGRVKVFTLKYPQYKYGDVLKIDGKVEALQEEFKNYYLKDGITARMRNPKITPTSENDGFWVKRSLFAIRNFVRDSFYKVLSPERASFMAGLVLGDTSGFTKEFRDKLSVTGTSHLVALSGYNILIIVIAIGYVIHGFVSRSMFFILNVLAILAFVVMTGAEASVVRAAIMGSLMLIANQAGRLYDFRNATALAALAMVLWNPRVLVWDVGFQLSFLALIGIVYLAPWLKKRFRISDEPGFLSWRENFLKTTSAQLAVLPLLLYHFGYTSPLGIITNILILKFIPLTMTFGFFIALASTFSHLLAMLISFPASVLISYELGIINLFTYISSFISSIATFF